MGVANERSVQLLRHFGTAEDAYIGINDSNLHFLKEAEKNAYKTASVAKSAEIAELAHEHGYNIVTLDDERYPELLKNIHNPPIVLFVKGNIDNNNVKLAVVGARTPSDYSYVVAERICRALAQNSVVIVSGMAVGIDKTAHCAALKEKGVTFGVLACGFDVDYPKGSKTLRDDIVAHGGAILTEQLPGGRPELWYFQKRNRIISGLSHGTLVVEADEKSGCIITANHTEDQNRDLFCIPPQDIFEPRYSGVIPFLKDGAIPVFSHTDILENYLIREKKPPVAEKPHFVAASVLPAPATSPQKPKTFPNENRNEPENLSESQAKIYQLLKAGECTLDFLSEHSGLNFNTLNEALLELEIDGLVVGVGASKYKLN